MMNLLKGAAVGAVGVAGAAVAGGVLAARASRGRRVESASRWHVLTVNKPVDEVRAAALPEPLTRLGDAVEVALRRAAGDKGTEIAVRLRDGEPSGLPALRRAMREAKSLIETGEVLEPDARPSSRRTILNRPLEYATTHGREGGLL